MKYVDPHFLHDEFKYLGAASIQKNDDIDVDISFKIKIK